MANSLISSITLPNGTTYDIKDAYARQQLETLAGDLSGGMHYLGTTSSNISDGSTTNPVTIDSKSITAKAGDLVIKGNKEYIWSDITNGWREFGDLGSLKALAFKDSASGKTTPAGTVSKPTFSGTQANLSLSYTPAGSVSKATFTGTKGNISASYTPAGNVSIALGEGTANYTPAGTVTKPTFTGTKGTVVINGGTGTATYTPAGTISKPNVSVTPSSTTVNSITNVGTLPELTTTVNNEVLTIGFSKGTLPTKGSNTSVLTGASAALDAAPTFTGTGTRLTGEFTPAGGVSQPTFSGTGVELTASFAGTAGTATGEFTPAGTVSDQTFTGTAGAATGSYTPAGSVSQPTFTGTEATVTVQ